uniref:Uncharacterized protein n=1 Tax=Daucus carota subsp. sativus TaxID=79200 RepID=A0A162A640_DAUCS
MVRQKMMNNPLSGSMESLKSQSCCSKLLSNSSNESLLLEASKKNPLSLDSEKKSLTPSISSLNFDVLKFDVLDGEMKVQSPDNSALWESFFTDQLDGGDFMISSPVRNLPSPQGTRKWASTGASTFSLCRSHCKKEDYMLVGRYLHYLNRVVTTLGDSMQRVTSCFTEALNARLNATLTTKSTSSNSNPFTPFPPDSIEILKIYQILYQACPYIKCAHFTANQAIFEAFESEQRVHVIGLHILQGYQWPAFMQALTAHPGGPPFLQITGVGTSHEAVMETGRCLSELAHSLRVALRISPCW